MKNVFSPRALVWRSRGFIIRSFFAASAPAIALAQNGPPQHFQETDLVSDLPGLAKVTDPHLVNPWGMARSATGPWWVADNGTGLATVYNGAGVVQSLVVTIPALPGSTEPSAPTGMVFNPSASDFLVGTNQPAHFIFATEDGSISGWNSGTTAVLKVNNGGKAVYKGLALATSNGAAQLYAANFMTRSVDVFDREFKPVTLAAGAFHDPQVPADYSPFNVQTIDGWIYVTFAQKKDDDLDETAGPGRGYVDAFSPSGVLQKRLQWGTWFNAPWGVAKAPANFGGFGGMILVGQFGSGKVAAFDPVSGEFRGLMRADHGRTLSIDGLWTIAFGNGANAGPATTLFFAAGIDDEAHGLFGTITPLAGEDEASAGND